MRGNAGNDDLYGGAGNDTIYGGKGGDTTSGEAGSDDLYGGPGHDRIISGTGSNHRVFAGDGEQDIICVDPNSSGTIVTDDPQDTFIFNRSC
jgi:Ca2+-binding RTX toxin-like protein